MLAWDHLRFALALARHGTLARAAVALGLGPSEATAHFRAMEEEAGATLFLRTGARLAPTDAGRRVLRAAERMAEEMSRVDRVLPPASTERTPVRVSIDAALATLWLRSTGEALLPALGEVEFTFSGVGEAELSVGWARPARGGWTARRLGALGFAVYAASGYLAEHGRPRTTAGLAGHRWVLGPAAGKLSAADRWAARAGGPGATVLLRTDDPVLLLAAVGAGLGLGLLSQGAEDADPALIRLFPVPELRPRAVWLGRPGKASASPRLGRAAKVLDATLGEAIRRWQQRG